MPRELFKEVVSPGARVQAGSRYTMMLSVGAHVLIVAAVVIVPLMATGAMPSLPSGVPDFILAELPPAPPPLPTPPAPTPTAPTEAVNREAAPTSEPKDIGPELPPPVGDTAEGGVPSLGPPSSGGFGAGDGIGRNTETPIPAPVPVPQKPLRPGGDIREPVKVKHVPPVYPQIAINARIDGRVVIDAVIGTDGLVRDARVLSGVPLLNQAALDAVRQWRYTPTMLNNVPVQVIMTVTVQFNLQR
jgi:periplasmic protein TonB